MSLKRKNFAIKTIVQTSLFIALALVVRNFSYMVYIGGTPGMRIGFSGVFTRITAILFGPFFGGAASGIIDIIGFMIKPEGAFIPFLTLTAILGGILTGILWKAAKNINVAKLQRTFLAFVILIGILGIVNHIQILYFPDTLWSQIIKRLGKYKSYTTTGLEIVALIGFILILANVVLKKLHTQTEIQGNFFKVIIAIGISGIVVTTLNTYILRVFIPELGNIPFLIFWVPRVIQEVLMTIVQAYIISLLISVYRKI